MASDVIRIDKELKEQIKQIQIEVAKETGKWISQAEALKRLLNNEINKTQ